LNRFHLAAAFTEFGAEARGPVLMQRNRETEKFDPADAAPEVRARADYICPQRGGEGAVRGAVEKILRGDGRWNDAVKKAFQVEL
jgi:3-deoxy-D-manno-octulosonate 8-phosphate phosphatase KdsC-like HAD superfamily phosphatase